MEKIVKPYIIEERGKPVEFDQEVIKANQELIQEATSFIFSDGTVLKKSDMMSPWGCPLFTTYIDGSHEEIVWNDGDSITRKRIIGATAVLPENFG
jgi:hypothetical protein